MTVAERDPGHAAVSPKAVSTARAFARAHGGSARAVIENLGRAGARIVLIGQDGGLGDVVVADIASGEALVAAVEELVASEWDTETTTALRIGARHRRRMAGPRAR